MTMESVTTPLVSIGIPTYNGSHRIIRALSSLWKQGYPNLEIIISDNCSTDNTQEVMDNICKDHPEIRYYRQPKNIGMMPNFRFLLSNASGKYFMWLSDDDQIQEGTIPRYVKFMEEASNYSLVSGAIKYWKDQTLDLTESGFTFEQQSSSTRVIDFYGKVIFCGLMHGMMRRELAVRIPLHTVIGNDYHFIANLAYLGKIKNFDYVGYHKNLGGSSKSFKQYAKAMGESKLTGIFPHLKMSTDAFKEVVSRSPVYASRPLLYRLYLGTASTFAILFCYYGRILIGARVRNFIITPIQNIFRKQKRDIL